ncbi:AAA family ATPase [Halodesulfovibrio sp.]|jgi:predicted ABC-type ATPase|uniref:AAA family ATPase n=1 Tax=Halodesulfovibrio sp. TaxID=1912772 RepID=UPI0025EA28FF|nr:AAA family ATPase [Halodesulfovibrio sp.]MCT4625685.1 AAA family ATPase [Halodesulfovibrio sp.]
MAKPQLWIVAGPNGSGKTTLTMRHLKRFPTNIPVVNPDEIAKDINPGQIDSPKVALQAGKQALRQQRDLLVSRQSFLIETTFSGNHELRLIGKAQEQGYKVNLIYIALRDATRNISRVASRVAAGGHNIPTVDIIRRYGRSLRNAPKGIFSADRTFVVDNSRKRHQLLFTRKHGLIQFVTPEVQQPEWSSNVLLGYEQEQLKDLQQYVGTSAKSELLRELADCMLEAGIKFNIRIKQLRQYAGVLNVTPEEKMLPSVKSVLRRMECGLKRC